MPLLGGVLLGGKSKQLPPRSKSEIKDLIAKTYENVYKLEVRKENLTRKIAALKRQAETGKREKYSRMLVDKAGLARDLADIARLYGGRKSRKDTKNKVNKDSAVGIQLADAEAKLEIVRSRIKLLNNYISQLEKEYNGGKRAVKPSQETIERRIAKRAANKKAAAAVAAAAAPAASGSGLYKMYAKKMGAGPISFRDLLKTGLDMYGGRKKKGGVLLGGRKKKGGAMSGGRKKGVPAALRPWQQHLQNVRAENPHLSLKQAMQVASQSYRK
jgi:hypothetical protein